MTTATLLTNAADVIEVDDMVENRALVAQLRAAAARDRWVPVGERLPESRKRVLCVVHGEVVEATYFGEPANHFRVGSQRHFIGVTHWRDLPQWQGE